MKKIILTGIIAVCMTTIHAQPFQAAEFDVDSAEVYKAIIDDHYQQMDDSSRYWVKEEYTFTCEYHYGVVSLFSENGKLRILKLEHDGEYGSLISTFYFDHGRLFYILTTTQSYEPGFYDPSSDDQNLYHYEEQYVYLYQEWAFDCSSRELSYIDDHAMQYFYDIALIKEDCELNDFKQELSDLFNCYPFKDFEPCLCNE